MMRARSILTTLAVSLAVSGCSQTPVVVPLRSMERPRDVDFICLEDTGRGAWQGASLDKCYANFDRTAKEDGTFRLHAVVTQTSRGEVAVVDLGRTPAEQDKAALLKADPRIPGYSFIPVGAAPTDVVADPNGGAVYVSSGRDPRIDILPARLLRGPVDTAAASADPPPWPHLDFDRETEGIPSAMAIVKRGVNNRLYVTLPDATPSAKIAVFDLSSPIVPTRIGDIALGAPAAQPLPVRTSLCGPKGTGAPWWFVYDQCAGEPQKLPGGVVTADPAATDFRPAGVAVAGGKMFVADDNAPVIHVFDIEGGAALEIRRIAVGSSTSRLAVSPVVPDEVTIENSAAIETCVARGWLGDGLDHSADSVEVGGKLGGRCRAHRYIYAIDLRNEEAGNGAIAVVDLPVTYALDAGGLIKLTSDGVPETERIDFDAAELVQPMACDAPSFPARRLPLGPFGVSVGNTVPARTVSFVEIDYPSRVAGRTGKAVRCRPFAKHPFATAEYEGVPEADAEARRLIGADWANGVSPRRLRGVFAWVALSNGALVVVDLDDYDSVCRGPKTSSSRGSLFLHPDEPTGTKLPNPPIDYGASRTDEYLMNPVRRHHARSLRLFDANLKPAVGSVVFSRFDSVISNDPTNENGRTYPHFAALDVKPADATRAPVVLPAPDNPFAVTTETWQATYEGMLPGFTGAFGALNDEGGKPVLRDPNRSLCDNGVESDGPIESHDVVQLLDEPCEFGSCPNPTECTQWFGATTETPLKPGRSLLIEKAHDDQLVIGNKHFELSVDPNNLVETFALADGPPDLARIKRCFGDGLLRYSVRTRGSWVVVGSASGYLHRRIVDPASADKACITDTSKPRILNGRATELPPLTDFSKLTVLEDNIVPAPSLTDVGGPKCLRFANPVWTFAIRRGTSPSSQDMRFTFGGRFNWQPLSVGAGSLIGSMKPVSAQWDGVERLNWNMIAAVDAIDRGLVVFPAFEPFAYQKGAN